PACAPRSPSASTTPTSSATAVRIDRPPAPPRGGRGWWRMSDRTLPRPDDEIWGSRRRHPTARPVVAGRRPRTFGALLGVITALNLLGLIMVLSASSVS